jgi:hypothetical protein
MCSGFALGNDSVFKQATDELKVVLTVRPMTARIWAARGLP